MADVQINSRAQFTPELNLEIAQIQDEIMDRAELKFKDLITFEKSLTDTMNITYEAGLTDKTMVDVENNMFIPNSNKLAESWQAELDMLPYYEKIVVSELARADVRDVTAVTNQGKPVDLLEKAKVRLQEKVDYLVESQFLYPINYGMTSYTTPYDDLTLYNTSHTYGNGQYSGTFSNYIASTFSLAAVRTLITTVAGWRNMYDYPADYSLPVILVNPQSNITFLVKQMFNSAQVYQINTTSRNINLEKDLVSRIIEHQNVKSGAVYFFSPKLKHANKLIHREMMKTAIEEEFLHSSFEVFMRFGVHFTQPRATAVIYA